MKLRFVVLGAALAALTGCIVETSGGTDVPAGTASSAEVSASTGESGGKPFRVVSANLTAGQRQSYDTGEGGRILSALKADLALVQEFNVGDNAPSTVQAWVSTVFGPEYTYTRESDNAQIPNGIVSRYPILDSGTWNDKNVSNRAFVWAKIDLPGPRDLFAVSVHFLTANASSRQNQANDLRAQLEKVGSPDDYIVVGGDMNTSSFSEPAFRELAPMVSHGNRFPADGNGNHNTNRARKKPFDQVLLSAPLQRAQVPTELGGVTFPDGLVFDTRAFPKLDSVPPARRADSDAPEMQHMAVIRDIALPAN